MPKHDMISFLTRSDSELQTQTLSIPTHPNNICLVLIDTIEDIRTELFNWSYSSDLQQSK